MTRTVTKGLIIVCVAIGLVATSGVAQTKRYRTTFSGHRASPPAQFVPPNEPHTDNRPVFQDPIPGKTLYSVDVPFPPEPVGPTGPQPDVKVAVTGGTIGGQELEDGTVIFKAVPFARPPVGDLRWRRPEPVTPWQGTRYKTDSAPACLQVSYGWQADMAAKSSEDCLYLEVRTPSLEAEARMPVMVFIHGGANRAGGGMGTVMSALVEKDVVLISIQYRLGVFGFMSHPALSAETGGASGNYALMDQIAALQWVRDNAAKFGGDPDNVTVFGHSAGAQDVGLLMASPLAKDLFQKAIEESGPPQFGLPARTLAENEAMGVELAREFTVDDAAPDGAQALQTLRRAPAMVLQTMADKLKVPVDDASFIWLQAVVDGYVLPKSPRDVFRAGEQAPVPLIIGTSARELGLYGGQGAVYSTIQREFGDKRLRVLGFYGLDVKTSTKDDPVLGDTAMQLSTDLMMRCPSDWTAWHVNAAGQPAWVYQLDIDAGDVPVHHSSELAFVFNKRPADKRPEQWPPLLDYWAQFAWTGHPNSHGLPVWPSYGHEGYYIEFTAKGPVAHNAMRLPVCELRDTP